MSRRDRISRTGVQNAIFVAGLVCCAISQFHLPSLLDEGTMDGEPTATSPSQNHGINSAARERRLEEEIIEEPAPKPTPPPAPILSVPLHSEHGTHHAYLYVGSPPQRRTLIVDTGSRLVAFPCTSCTNCGKHASKSYYDPAISTTDIVNTCAECEFEGMSKCNNNTCQFVQRYTEGSRIQAYEITDIMWLGTGDVLESMADPKYISTAVPFVFGCQTSEEGLFRSQYADGIFGTAMHQTTLIAAMYEAGAIPRHAFSLCLNYEGGIFSLGGTDLTLRNESTATLPEETGNETSILPSLSGPYHLEPMQYAPLAKNHGWYAVGVVSVHVGDILITTTKSFLSAFNDVKGTIIDSGTTDSYLPKVVAQPFMKAWENITGLVYSNKLERYTYSKFLKLPNITITVGAHIRWSSTPSNYMEEIVLKREKPGEKSEQQIRRVDITKPWNGAKSFTNRIYLDEPKGCVLGGNFMADHDIMFDITNKRIGIARAECTYRESKYIVV